MTDKAYLDNITIPLNDGRRIVLHYDEWEHSYICFVSYLENTDKVNDTNFGINSITNIIHSFLHNYSYCAEITGLILSVRVHTQGKISKYQYQQYLEEYKKEIAND